MESNGTTVGTHFRETAYIAEVNEAKKVKSDAQLSSHEQELGPFAETVPLGVAGEDGTPTPIFQNFRNCLKRVELGSSYSGCRYHVTQQIVHGGPCSHRKVVEMYILEIYNDVLYYADLQFGFKKYLSCNSAIYAVKSLCDYYISKGSTVNVCFLDMSKAFHKVNHYSLFSKLMTRNTPVEFINVLVNYPSHIYSI